MNWIDDKYKEKLGNKSFPNSLKEAGWAKAEQLLDKEMPIVPLRGTGVKKGYWLALTALIAIPTVLWYFTQPSVLPTDAKEMPINKNNDLLEQHVVIENDDSDASQAKEDISSPFSNTDAKQNKASMTNGSDENSDLSAINETQERSDEIGATIEASPENNDQSAGHGFGTGGLVAGDDGLNAVEIAAVNDSISNDNDAIVSSGSSEEEPNFIGSNNESENGTIDPTGINNNPQNDSSNDGSETAADALGNKEINPTHRDTLDTQEVGGGKEFLVNIPGVERAIDSVDEPDVPSKLDEDSIVDSNNETVTPPDNTGIPDPSAKTFKKQLQNLAFADLGADSDEGYQLFSRKRFALSYWGGISYTDKFISAGNSLYTDKRSAEEDAVWTTPTGIDIDYFLDRNWTFGIGISYAEYGENLAYNISLRDTLKIDGRNNTPSDFQGVVASDSVRVIEGINKGHWNYTVFTELSDSATAANNGRTSWQYIEIPLTIGYRFGSGNLKPWIRTGVSIGIPTATSFRYLNTEATYLNDVSLKSDRLVAPLQYNYLLNIGLDYYLSRSFSLRCNAISSFQLNSSLKQADVEQRYYRLGMSFGLAYNF